MKLLSELMSNENVYDLIPVKIFHLEYTKYQQKVKIEQKEEEKKYTLSKVTVHQFVANAIPSRPRATNDKAKSNSKRIQ